MGLHNHHPPLFEFLCTVFWSQFGSYVLGQNRIEDSLQHWNRKSKFDSINLK